MIIFFNFIKIIKLYVNYIFENSVTNKINIAQIQII